MSRFLWGLLSLFPGRKARGERPTTPQPARVWTAPDSTLKTHAYEFTLHRAYRNNNNKNTTSIQIKETSGYIGLYTIHELEIYAADPRARKRIQIMSRAALEFARSSGIEVQLP